MVIRQEEVWGRRLRISLSLPLQYAGHDMMRLHMTTEVSGIVMGLLVPLLATA